MNPAIPGGGGSGRQPGSSFKPFVAAAALEAGYPPGYTIDARGPKVIEGCFTVDEEEYVVNNSGGDDILDMAGAIARSSNVYHAELTADVGPLRVAEMARRLGVPVPDRDVACALGLGATDITPLAMASGYATLANSGVACTPHPIERIETADGRLLWEHSPDCRRVVDEEVAAQVVALLEGPVLPGGTAPIANLGDWATRGQDRHDERLRRRLVRRHGPPARDRRMGRLPAGHPLLHRRGDRRRRVRRPGVPQPLPPRSARRSRT